jgi:hypothetical protein
MFFNPFAMWFSLVSPMIERYDRRRVALQFDNRTPWQDLSSEEKLERDISDNIKAWGP